MDLDVVAIPKNIAIFPKFHPKKKKICICYYVKAIIT